MQTQIDAGKQQHRPNAHTPHGPDIFESSPLHPTFQLQQQAGNQAVQALLRNGFIQAKLTISSPDDPAEREADQVAHAVMRMHSGALESHCSCGGGEEACEECQQKQSGPEIQRSAASPSTPAHIPGIVGRVLRSPGHPLDSSARAFFEPRFSHDFSRVRVHEDADAAQSAQAVQAKAYTVGHNIVFGAGQFGPTTHAGRSLLAHELVHVIQQRDAPTDLQHLSLSGESSDKHEREADIAGSAVSLGQNARVTGRLTSSIVQRAGLDIVLGGAAGGCGICYGIGNIKQAGLDAHQQIKQDFELEYPNLLPEFPIEVDSATRIITKGIPDLIVPTPTGFKLGEIKPANPEGYIEGEAKLAIYEDLLHERYGDVNPNLTVERMNENPPGAFPFIEPAAIGCSPQILSVNRSIRGVYGYFCYPPFSYALRSRCKCDGKEPDPDEPKEDESKDKDTNSGESLIDKLEKIGEEAAKLLAEAALLDVAMDIALTLGALVASPLVALAALVLGVVYFWDELKAIGSKIASVAKWVFGKISWVLGKVAWLGEKLGELGAWLGDKIAFLAKKLAEGIEWAADEVVSGVKWTGRKIASGAKAVWDWLFGDDPEPQAPDLDLPVTEDTTHCATVAHEDTIVKIGADLLFATAEYKLKAEADGPLQDAADKIRPMLSGREDRVMIAGYTDNVGGVEYNQHLSEQRAQSVADWFDQHHIIPKTIIHTEGYGKTQALANDPDGRAKDRHVEIWVTKHGSTEKVCW